MMTEEHKRKIVATRRKNGSYVAWNKGKACSKETRLKISKSHMGSVPWNKGKKGVMPELWNKGKHHSVEARKKMSASHTGVLLSVKHRNSLKGRKFPESWFAKQRSRVGKKVVIGKAELQNYNIRLGLVLNIFSGVQMYLLVMIGSDKIVIIKKVVI